MPFITEEIWQKLPTEGTSIMTARFPAFDPEMEDSEAETHLQWVMEIINATRNIRGEMNLKPSLKIPLRVKTADPEKELITNNSAHYVKELARLEDLEVGPAVVKPKVSASSMLSGAEVIVPLEGLMDFGEEKKRVEKELKKIEKEIIFLNKKLSNPNFVDRAPADVIEKDRQKHQDLSEKKTKLQVHLNTIEQALA